jgi:hypothetical protein
MDQTNAMDAEISWGGFWYGRWGGVPNPIAAAGALPVKANINLITNGAATALTLAAPVAGSQASGGQDYMTLEVISSTAFAHTVTATGLLQTGSANVNVATFAAFAGANLNLMAYNGKWIVLSAIGITFS